MGLKESELQLDNSTSRSAGVICIPHNFNQLLFKQVQKIGFQKVERKLLRLLLSNNEILEKLGREIFEIRKKMPIYGLNQNNRSPNKRMYI